MRSSKEWDHETFSIWLSHPRGCEFVLGKGYYKQFHEGLFLSVDQQELLEDLLSSNSQRKFLNVAQTFDKSKIALAYVIRCFRGNPTMIYTFPGRIDRWGLENLELDLICSYPDNENAQVRPDCDIIVWVSPPAKGDVIICDLKRFPLWSGVFPVK